MIAANGPVCCAQLTPPPAGRAIPLSPGGSIGAPNTRSELTLLINSPHLARRVSVSPAAGYLRRMLSCGRLGATPALATARTSRSARRPALTRVAVAAEASGGGGAAAAAGRKLLWLSTANQVCLQWLAMWCEDGCLLRHSRATTLHSAPLLQPSCLPLPPSQDALTAGLEAGVSTVVFEESQAPLAQEWQQLGRFEAVTRTADGRLLGADGKQVGASGWLG